MDPTGLVILHTFSYYMKSLLSSLMKTLSSVGFAMMHFGLHEPAAATSFSDLKQIITYQAITLCLVCSMVCTKFLSLIPWPLLF